MSSTALIFLHGFPFNATAWQPQVDHFRDRFAVYAPNLRGHSSAAAPPGPWMISHYVQDLKKMMDEAGLSKAVLCGLSMGGYVALQFVMKYPDRVAGVVLCDTRADADSNDAKEKRFETIEKIRRDGLTDFAKDFAKQVLSESTLRSRPEIRDRVEQMILDQDPKNVAMVLGALASRLDTRSALPSIRCPTAVFVGAEDRVTPPELSELIAGGIEDAELTVIENAGHLSNVEQPDRFNSHLEEFLENNFSRRPVVAQA